MIKHIEISNIKNINLNILNEEHRRRAFAGDSTGEAQHSGRVSDQQFLVSHVVPLASYSRLFSTSKH